MLGTRKLCAEHHCTRQRRMSSRQKTTGKTTGKNGEGLAGGAQSLFEAPSKILPTPPKPFPGLWLWSATKTTHSVLLIVGVEQCRHRPKQVWKLASHTLAHQFTDFTLQPSTPSLDQENGLLLTGRRRTVAVAAAHFTRRPS